MRRSEGQEEMVREQKMLAISREHKNVGLGESCVEVVVCARACMSKCVSRYTHTQPPLGVG